jgi:hypothetical protein
MVALVSVETVLLVLLVLLVAGLLRSHAEILRRLGPGDQVPDPVGPLAGASVPSVPGPPEPPAGPRPEHAAPIAGVTPAGDAVALDFAGGATMPTLLAFLTTGCTVCAGFWSALGERQLPGVQTVIVTHGAERERPARLRSLAPAGLPVIMSSQAFRDYAVPGSPYFVLVDGGVLGEGSASTWEAVASLVGDALADERDARGGQRRAEQVDEILAAAGIEAGHPSLYPGREAP